METQAAMRDVGEVSSLQEKKIADMLEERDQLELEVKRRLAVLHKAASNSHEAPQETSQAVRRLALESELLRNENLEIYQKLQQLKRLWSLAQEGLLDVSGDSKSNVSGLNLYEASKKSEWVCHRDENEPGWRVHFPNDAPSFYFHPFSRGEFDAVYKEAVDDFQCNRQQIEAMGNFFGWSVHHAPLLRRPTDNSVVANARFSMRVNFSLESVDQLVLNSDLKWLPLIVTPPNWSDNNREAVSSQVLQEFETDAYMMVCNIPGDFYLRYLHLVRRQPRKLSNGKRAIAYTMVIAESEANVRSHAAEELQNEVVWAREGANTLEVTEVDDKTVDIMFEFKASCQNESHARHHFVYWTQFVCRWSQRIVPPKLLETL